MGEVYIARDTRLNRNVALKIIASGSSDDALRQRRFTVEARAASALNHPHIITVHDFGSADGISYIVSELIDGESLRDIIKRGPLPAKRMLEVAVQIADGLAAAHEAGIVHRDLKPENIMVTRSGRVKILDFGLAKPVLSAAATIDEFDEQTFDGLSTQPGLIVGTVGYMSPEQARGEDVSFQSDQFSLGLILHEMASGQPAFRRDTPMQTLLAIANVDHLPFTPGPVAFRLLVERLLKKDPGARFGSTTEVHDRLQKILSEIPTVGAVAPLEERSEEAVVPVEARPRRLPALVLLGGLLAFGLGILAARFMMRAGEPDVSKIRYAPITATGLQLTPSLSRDHSAAAYAQEVDGVLQIFLRTMNSGAERQLTHAAEDCLAPVWSPDGAHVYFVSAGSLWSASTLGGAPARILDNVAGLDASSDGQTLGVLRPERAGESLWLLNPQPKRLDKAPLFGSRSVVKFAPDGKSLGVWSPDGFWTVSLNGSAHRVADYPAEGFAWMADGDRILFGDDHLWLLNAKSGQRRQLTAGAGREDWPAVAGNEGVFATTLIEALPASVPIAAAAPKLALPRFASSPVWSPKRPEYAYVFQNEIRLRDARSGWERTLVKAPNVGGDLAFSPDGQHVAYVSDSRIYTVGLDGETPVLLEAVKKELPRSPAWSPDGNWIAYTTPAGLYKVHVGTREKPVEIPGAQGTEPAWSPDGQRIALLNASGVVLGGRQIARGPWLSIGWTHDGRLLGVRRTADRHLELGSINTGSGATQRLADLGPCPPGLSFTGSLSRLSVAPDDSSVLVSIPHVESHIWTFSGF